MLNRGSVEYARFWQPSNLELKKGGNVAIKEGGGGIVSFARKHENVRDT